MDFPRMPIRLEVVSNKKGFTCPVEGWDYSQATFETGLRMPKVTDVTMDIFFAAKGEMDFEWTGTFASRVSLMNLPRFHAQISTGTLKLKSAFTFGVQVDAQMSKKFKFPLGPRIDLLHMQLP